jgi:hypothetical protein
LVNSFFKKEAEVAFAELPLHLFVRAVVEYIQYGI